MILELFFLDCLASETEVAVLLSFQSLKPITNSGLSLWKIFDRPSLDIWNTVLNLLSPLKSRRKNREDRSFKVWTAGTMRFADGLYLIDNSFLYFNISETADRSQHTSLRYLWKCRLWKILGKVTAAFSSTASFSSALVPRCLSWRVTLAAWS